MGCWITRLGEGRGRLDGFDRGLVELLVVGCGDHPEAHQRPVAVELHLELDPGARILLGHRAGQLEGAEGVLLAAGDVRAEALFGQGIRGPLRGGRRLAVSAMVPENIDST